MPGHVALHVGHFFGPLVDQQEDELDVRDSSRGCRWAMFCSRIVLPRARRGDDQAALAEADGREDVDHARGELVGVVLELDASAAGSSAVAS